MESLRSSGDFRELLSLFNAEEVGYLIVAGLRLRITAARGTRKISISGSIAARKMRAACSER